MTGSELQTRLFQRLEEDATQPVYYRSPEVLAALNEGQRLFVLLTLCLEKTASLPLAGGQSHYRLLQTFTDYLLPLRVRVAGASGKKVNYCRLEDLDALNLSWQAEPGTPQRYAHLGFDFFAIHPRPASGGTSLDFTFARCPAVFTATGTPEIPEEHHPALIDYAIPRLRAKEGGAQFLSSLKYFNRFLDVAGKLADYVRARNKAQQYDRGPFELKAFDRSKLLAAAFKPMKRPTSS